MRLYMETAHDDGLFPQKKGRDDRIMPDTLMRVPAPERMDGQSTAKPTGGPTRR